MLFLFHLLLQLSDVVKRFIDISTIYFNLMKALNVASDEDWKFLRKTTFCVGVSLENPLSQGKSWRIKIEGVAVRGWLWLRRKSHFVVVYYVIHFIIYEFY